MYHNNHNHEDVFEDQEDQEIDSINSETFKEQNIELTCDEDGNLGCINPQGDSFFDFKLPDSTELETIRSRASKTAIGSQENCPTEHHTPIQINDLIEDCDQIFKTNDDAFLEAVDDDQDIDALLRLDDQQLTEYLLGHDDGSEEERKKSSTMTMQHAQDIWIPEKKTLLVSPSAVLPTQIFTGSSSSSSHLFMSSTNPLPTTHQDVATTTSGEHSVPNIIKHTSSDAILDAIFASAGNGEQDFIAKDKNLNNPIKHVSENIESRESNNEINQKQYNLQSPKKTSYKSIHSLISTKNIKLKANQNRSASMNTWTKNFKCMDAHDMETVIKMVESQMRTSWHWVGDYYMSRLRPLRWHIPLAKLNSETHVGRDRSSTVYRVLGCMVTQTSRSPRRQVDIGPNRETIPISQYTSLRRIEEAYLILLQLEDAIRLHNVCRSNDNTSIDMLYHLQNNVLLPEIYKLISIERSSKESYHCKDLQILTSMLKFRKGVRLIERLIMVLPAQVAYELINTILKATITSESLGSIAIQLIQQITSTAGTKYIKKVIVMASDYFSKRGSPIDHASASVLISILERARHIPNLRASVRALAIVIDNASMSDQNAAESSDSISKLQCIVQDLIKQTTAASTHGNRMRRVIRVTCSQNFVTPSHPRPYMRLG